MSCTKRVRWYVVSHGAERCYGYARSGKIGMIINTPWTKPYLFKTMKEARMIAYNNNATIRHWPGKHYKNSVTDNK